MEGCDAFSWAIGFVWVNGEVADRIGWVAVEFELAWDGTIRALLNGFIVGVYVQQFQDDVSDGIDEEVTGRDCFKTSESCRCVADKL